MTALDLTPRESESTAETPARSQPSGEAWTRSFAERWTATFLALFEDLREGVDDPHALERTAAILVRHGARMIEGTQCVISIVPPERPEHFSVLAGEGLWASKRGEEEWPVDGTLNGRAMLSGEPVESTDVSAESATPEVFGPGSIESGRVVPLRLQAPLTDGRLAMGAVGFWRSGHAAFTPEERLLIDTFGETASVLLHRSELLVSANETARRLQSAVDVAVETSTSLVPTAVIRGLLEHSLHAVNADRASLCRVHGTTITVLDVVDRDGSATGTGHLHEQPWHPAILQAVQERRAILLGPFESLEVAPGLSDAIRGSERTLLTPLLAGKQVVALLSLTRRYDRPFSEADVRTVQLFGNIASLSLRNAERFSESERAHKRSLHALGEITRHVDDTHGLRDIFGRLASTAAALVGAQRAAFFRVGRNGVLQLIDHPHNIAVVPRPTPRTLRRGSQAWRVVFEDETSRSSDAKAASMWLPGLAARSTLAVPWRASDKVLGSLVVFDAVDPQGFTDEDAWVLRIAALAAGLVWQHKEVEARELQLAREARERVHEIAVVQDAAQALSLAVDVDDVFRQVVQSAAHVVTPPGSSARRATLLRVEGNSATIIAEYDELGMRTELAEYDLDEHPQMRRVLERDEVVIIDPAHEDVAAPTARQMASVGVRSSALAPVRVDDRVVAILRVSARDETGFGAAHRERLLAIANVAALAMGNAERYQLAHREALRRAELENIKSEFLRLASHELRGPIGLLRGYLSMFEDGTVPSVSGKARETLPILLAKIAQMSRMVDDMLETARLEEGQTQLNIQVADLREIVKRSVATVQPLASPAHTVRVRVPSAPVRVAADSSSVETIVTNLLDNAIKYSPSGGLIDCTLRRTGRYASVAVRDRGLGIDPADLPRLFTRFGRILTPENSHIGGTGLGLHLARELARMQDGTITARSRPGQGSVFTFRLPLSDDGAQAGGGVGERPVSVAVRTPSARR